MMELMELTEREANRNFEAREIALSRAVQSANSKRANSVGPAGSEAVTAAGIVGDAEAFYDFLTTPPKKDPERVPD